MDLIFKPPMNLPAKKIEKNGVLRYLWTAAYIFFARKKRAKSIELLTPFESFPAILLCFYSIRIVID